MLHGRRFLSGARWAQRNADTAAFAALEHRNWQKAVSAYDRTFGPLTSQCIPALLDATLPALPATGSARVLDVATGPGMVAEAALQRSAEVVALDFSRKMLDLAEERLGNSVEFVEADAGSMPFEANSFDAVLCSFGVLHLPVPEAFFSEAFRLLRPSGKLGFTVWAAAPETEAMALIHEAVQTHGDLNVPLPEAPPFFRFANFESSRQALLAAGFAEVKSQKVPMVWELDSAEDLFVGFRDGTGRTAELLALQGPRQLAEIQRFVTARAEETRSAGGPCRFHMPCVLTVATKR
ncbi:unnamed protein product [Effrenium voratum]|nr:unnamed protein product [Effrenium voratum]